MATISLRPAPLGKIAPAGTGNASKLNLCNNFLPTSPTPGDYYTPGKTPMAASDAMARRIDIKCPSDSVGRVYIGDSQVDVVAVDTHMLHALFFLEAGESFTIENPQQPQPYHVGDYWVVIDTAGGYITADFDPS